MEAIAGLDAGEVNGVEPTAVPRPGAGDILAIGFGTTVVMWAAGYACRMPPTVAPSWVLLLLMVGALAAGGIAIGRYTGRGWQGGLFVGLLSGAVNLLILGSLLTGDQPNRVVPSALWWIPGSVLAAGALGSIGAAAGSRFSSSTTACPNWTAVFAWVAVTATVLLLIAGGLVTGYQAGLAVVDWPNSFGYNMFLYPLSRMTGGIYYEHAHRLFGSLVGLTTMVLAFFLYRTDERKWLRALALLALGLVIVQGILGGLRVTGRPTFSTSPAEISPNIYLAIVHGVFAQVFLSTLVSIAVFTSTRWRSLEAPTKTPSARGDQWASGLLVVALIAQLVLGAILRHLNGLLLVHLSFGAVVAVLAIRGGVRAWGLYAAHRTLVRIGQVLVFLTMVQLLLGLSALTVTRAGLALPLSVDASSPRSTKLSARSCWWSPSCLCSGTAA